MSDFETIIDFGSKNLRLSIFDEASKIIYSSKQKIIDSNENSSLEKSLNILVRNAEKFLSTHIDNVIVLYDSSKFYSTDISIKKVFDQPTFIKTIYNNLIEEARFLISQQNFKDKIIHLVVNNIIVDEKENLNKIVDNIKIKSLILDVKFICLSKILIDDISKKFKKNNLKISNLYCSSYVKTIFFKKNFDTKNYFIFLDIGYKRTSLIIFNNNKFEFFNSIPLGSDDITKDISKVLKLNLDYSEDLKVRFNNNENDVFMSNSEVDSINPYSEILEKNIPIDLLKEVIEARLDEIIKLLVLECKNFKDSNLPIKPILVIIGGGSKLFLNNYNLGINKFVSKKTILDDKDSLICEAALNYNRSDESFHTKTRKKTKKLGIFERFFNIFSK